MLTKNQKLVIEIIGVIVIIISLFGASILVELLTDYRGREMTISLQEAGMIMLLMFACLFPTIIIFHAFFKYCKCGKSIAKYEQYCDHCGRRNSYFSEKNFREQNKMMPEEARGKWCRANMHSTERYEKFCHNCGEIVQKIIEL